MRKNNILSLTTAIMVILMISPRVSQAQEWSLTTGEQSKALKVPIVGTSLNNTGYIGSDGQRIVLIRDGSKRNTRQLVSYDLNLNELAQTDLVSDEDITYYGGFLNENSIDLLYTRWTKTGMQAYHSSFDPTTLKQKGEPVELNSYKITKDDRLALTLRSSQSTEFTGTIYVVKNDQGSEARVSLYDKELDELWSMDYSFTIVDDYIVTDSGEVVFCGFYKEKSSKETHFEFAVLDGEREYNYSCEEEVGIINRIDILKYQNGKVYCVGLLGDKDYDVSDGVSSGYYSLVFDTKTGEISHFEKVEFTKVDANRMYNAADKAFARRALVDKMIFASSQYSDNDAAIAYERMFNLYVNGQYQHSEYNGMLTICVDNKGKILWNNITRRCIRRSNVPSNSIPTKMVYEGGNYYVFYPDIAKNAKIKPERPVTAVPVANGKVKFHAISFDNNGNATHLFIDKPARVLCLGGPHKIADGRYIQLFTGIGKSYAGLLQFK